MTYSKLTADAYWFLKSFLFHNQNVQTLKWVEITLAISSKITTRSHKQHNYETDCGLTEKAIDYALKRSICHLYGKRGFTLYVCQINIASDWQQKH